MRTTVEIPNLPRELTLEILKLLCFSDQKSFSLLSHACRRLAVHILFRDIHVGWEWMQDDDDGSRHEMVPRGLLEAGCLMKSAVKCVHFLKARLSASLTG